MISSPGHAAGFEPGVATAQGRVAGEGQFLGGGEDPQAVVGPGIAGLEQKGGFAEVGPVGEGGHALGAELVGVEYHGQGVAFEGSRAEDIDLLET